MRINVVCVNLIGFLCNIPYFSVLTGPVEVVGRVLRNSMIEKSKTIRLCLVQFYINNTLIIVNTSLFFMSIASDVH